MLKAYAPRSFKELTRIMAREKREKERRQREALEEQALNDAIYETGLSPDLLGDDAGLCIGLPWGDGVDRDHYVLTYYEGCVPVNLLSTRCLCWYENKRIGPLVATHVELISVAPPEKLRKVLRKSATVEYIRRLDFIRYALRKG